MKLGNPILPIGPQSEYDRQLNKLLYDFFRVLTRKVNGISAGVFSENTDNASVALPTFGTYAKGDYVRKAVWVEAGVVTAKYVIKGWMRITDGDTHVLNTDWLEDRALTGN